MKNKVLLILFVIISIFMIGCKKNNEERFRIIESKKMVLVKDTNYLLESIYENYESTDLDEIQLYINNLNRVIYETAESNVNPSDYIYKYVIVLDYLSVYIINSNKFIIHENNVYNLCNKLGGSLTFVSDSKFNLKPTEVKKEEVTISFTNEQLQSIIFNDNIYSLDLSNNIYIKEELQSFKALKETDYSTNEKEIYTISLGNINIYFYNNNIIKYNNVYYSLLKPFNFIVNRIYSNSVITFSNINVDNKIVVINKENKSVELEEKEDFINCINKVKCIQLYNNEHYLLSDYQYKLEINNDKYIIYNEKFMKINDSLYYIIEGDFEYLDEIKFDSNTGWLPWV